MRAAGAVRLATADLLLPKFDVSLCPGRQHPGPFEVSGRKDQKAPKLMLVELPNRVDEIPIERHDASGNLERGKQPGSSPTIGKRPAKWRRHPIRMLAAHQVSGTGLKTFADVVQPDGPLPIVVGHYRRCRRSTSCTRSNHAGQPRRSTAHHQGFRLTRRVARKTILSFRAIGKWQLATASRRLAACSLWLGKGDGG